MAEGTGSADRHLEGRRAVVTGAASGIGAACARSLAAAGASVVLLDRAEDAVRALADELGGRAVVVDLSDTSALPAVLAGADLECDVLVNNAGVQHVARVEEFPPEQLSLMLRLMLEAPFLLARAVLPGMYARGHGRLIHVGSVHGHRASPFKAAYVAAKHGLEGLSKTIALEGGDRGVTSVVVCPGFVRTPLVEAQIAAQSRETGVPEERVVEDVLLHMAAVKRLLEPEEVGRTVAWLCRPEAASMTGTSVLMDGGWSAR